MFAKISEKKGNTFIVLIILAIIVLFGLHLVNIEADPPAWGVGVYQPCDEGPYAFMAINEKTYGTILPSLEQTGGYQNMVSENFIMNIIGNGLNILGFKVFGNNYYAMRIPYVLIFAVNFLLLAAILNKLRKKYSVYEMQGKLLMWLMLLWVMLDFSFLLSSRYVEPSSVRLMFLELVVLTFISLPTKNRLRFFLLGLLITFSVFLVYVTNIFLYLAVALLIIYIGVKEGVKKFFSCLGFFVLGAAVCFAVCELYYVVFWGKEAVINAINTFFSFSFNSGSSAQLYSATSVSEIIRMPFLIIGRILSANSLFYNLPVTFVFFAILPINIVYAKRTRDRNLIFLLFILGSFILQHLVSYDTITRKFIIAFPVVISLLFVFMIRQEEIAFVLKIAAAARKKDSCSMSVADRPRIYTVFWLIITLVLSLGVFLYRMFMFDQTSFDYSKRDTVVSILVGVVPVILAFIAFLIHDRGGFKKKPNEKVSKAAVKTAAAVIMIGTVLMNLYYSTRYVWLNHDYGEKNAMIAMADTVNGKYVLGGGFQLGFTLYNDMLPVINYPDVFMSDLEKNPDAYILEYNYLDNADGYIYFNNTFFKTVNIRLLPCHTIERTFRTFGSARNMYLYRKCDYPEFHRYLIDRDEQAKQALRYAIDSSPGFFDGGLLQQFQENRYPRIIGDTMGSDYSSTVFADIHGNIYGDLNVDVYGDIYGDIYGSLNGEVHGTVYGKVYGNE